MATTAAADDDDGLLIVPYGIETGYYCSCKCCSWCLLIVPYGIETF